MYATKRFPNNGTPALGAFNTLDDLSDPETANFAKALSAWQRDLTRGERSALNFWTLYGDGPMQVVARARGARDALSTTSVSDMLMYVHARLDNDDAKHLAEALADKSPKVQMETLESLSAIESLLHTAVSRAPRTPYSTILWRGLHDVDVNAIASDRRIRVTRSPQSWSRSPQTASRFTLGDRTPLMLALLVPKNARMADLWLRPARQTGIGQTTGEREVILPRGSHLQVVAAYAPQPFDKRATHIYCDVESPCEMEIQTTFLRRPLIVMRLVSSPRPSRASSQYLNVFEGPNLSGPMVPSVKDYTRPYQRATSSTFRRRTRSRNTTPRSRSTQ